MPFSKEVLKQYKNVVRCEIGGCLGHLVGHTVSGLHLVGLPSGNYMATSVPDNFAKVLGNNRIVMPPEMAAAYVLPGRNSDCLMVCDGCHIGLESSISYEANFRGYGNHFVPIQLRAEMTWFFAERGEPMTLAVYEPGIVEQVRTVALEGARQIIPGYSRNDPPGEYIRLTGKLFDLRHAAEQICNGRK